MTVWTGTSASHIWRMPKRQSNCSIRQITKMDWFSLTLVSLKKIHNSCRMLIKHVIYSTIRPRKNPRFVHQQSKFSATRPPDSDLVPGATTEQRKKSMDASEARTWQVAHGIVMWKSMGSSLPFFFAIMEHGKRRSKRQPVWVLKKGAFDSETKMAFNQQRRGVKWSQYPQGWSCFSFEHRLFRVSRFFDFLVNLAKWNPPCHAYQSTLGVCRMFQVLIAKDYHQFGQAYGWKMHLEKEINVQPFACGAYVLNQVKIETLASK